MRSGRMLYLGDYLEPGRRARGKQRAEWAKRVPRERDTVLREIVGREVRSRLRRGKPIECAHGRVLELADATLKRHHPAHGSRPGPVEATHASPCVTVRMEVALTRCERHHGVDARRAERGHCGGHQRYECERGGYAAEDRGVVWADADEESREDTG